MTHNAETVVGPWIIDGWICPTCRRSNWSWMRYCHHCREDRPLAGLHELDAHHIDGLDAGGSMDE